MADNLYSAPPTITEAEKKLHQSTGFTSAPPSEVPPGATSVFTSQPNHILVEAPSKPEDSKGQWARDFGLGAVKAATKSIFSKP